MAVTFVLLLCFFGFSLVTAQESQTNITRGSSLSPTTDPTSWLSHSGRFAFGFYPEGKGFAVGIWLTTIPNKTIVWTAHRNDPPVSSDARLVLNNTGSLVLTAPGGRVKLIPNASEPAALASMLDTGKFVLYNSNSHIIWQSFDYPTDTILVDQSLKVDNVLISSASKVNHSTGGFTLVMFLTGQLVNVPVIRTTTVADQYWRTETAHLGYNISMYLADGGRIFLLNSTGFRVWEVTDATRHPRNSWVMYRVTLDVDGIFRLYSHDFNSNSSSTPMELWAPFRDGCQVAAFCGLNGYCTLRDTKAFCSCPPGFDFVDPDYPFLGCNRNFTRQGCERTNNGNIKYSMSSLENTAWLDEPYAFYESMTKDDCREACLQDCNCEAASHSNGRCAKQKLPLSYGRTIVSGSTATTTFIKVGNASAAKTGDPSIWFETLANRRRDIRIEILIACIALAAGSFIGFAIFYFLVCRRHRRRYEAINDQHNVGLTEGISLRSFSYVELEKATESFKEELGKGAFGTVFKGLLSNKFIAVKRLDNIVEDREREFQTEMRAIGRIHHKNLVRLVGFCDDGCHKLLVYEYMRHGSLADLIFKPESRPNWDERVRITLDIARGILYLHEDCEIPIIHCDIKPQNILMDASHSAKLSDFGLAKLMKPDQTKTFTGIRGTRGYVAPEWHRTQPITVKADVYSFGVVLLEIICCRKNVEKEAPEHEIILSNWVYNCFKAGELTKLISEEEVDVRILERMVMIGLWCIQDEPALRPSMKKVVLMLEGIVDIPVPPIDLSF